MIFRDFKRINVEGAHLSFFFQISSSFMFFAFFFFFYSFQHINMKNKILVHKVVITVQSQVHLYKNGKEKNDIINKILILMALLHT